MDMKVVTPVPVPVTVVVESSAESRQVRPNGDSVPSNVTSFPSKLAKAEPPQIPAETERFRGGLDLSKRVFNLITLAIFLLIGYLAVNAVWPEMKSIAPMAYELTRPSDGSPTPEAVNALADALAPAGNGAGWETLRVPSESEQMVARLGMIARDVQARAALDRCLPAARAAPTNPNRTSEIDACLTALRELASEASEQNTARLTQLIEIQKLDLEQRQAFHSFWLSAAQLILLNLMLPITTAVLGYAFGTHQVGGRSDDQ